MPHRFFDHTGDFGVDLTADSLEGLYEEVACAFTALLTDALERVEEKESKAIEVEGVDETDLLVALGNELLYIFESQGWLVRRLEVERLEDDRLVATAHGEPFDEARHPIARPMKAVTHHAAGVDEDGEGGWRGRLIFDL